MTLSVGSSILDLGWKSQDPESLLKDSPKIALTVKHMGSNNGADCRRIFFGSLGGVEGNTLLIGVGGYLLEVWVICHAPRPSQYTSSGMAPSAESSISDLG